MGHSIGGAIATRLAAAQPGWPVAVCNSRSFATLSSLAVELAPAFFGLPPAGAKARWMRWIARAGLGASGWEYDSARAWARVRGFKWIEVSKADHIIPHQHSLHAAVTAGAGAGGGGGGRVGGGVRCIQLINLEGMDNHNRMWLEPEMHQVPRAARARVAAMPAGPVAAACPVAPGGPRAARARDAAGAADGEGRRWRR